MWVVPFNIIQAGSDMISLSPNKATLGGPWNDIVGAITLYNTV